MNDAQVHISLREGSENEARVVTHPRPKDPLSQEILRLKEELNAVLLAHNYQIPKSRIWPIMSGIPLDLPGKRPKLQPKSSFFVGFISWLKQLRS